MLKEEFKYDQISKGGSNFSLVEEYVAGVQRLRMSTHQKRLNDSEAQKMTNIQKESMCIFKRIIRIKICERSFERSVRKINELI